MKQTKVCFPSKITQLCGSQLFLKCSSFSSHAGERRAAAEADQRKSQPEQTAGHPSFLRDHRSSGLSFPFRGSGRVAQREGLQRAVSPPFCVGGFLLELGTQRHFFFQNGEMSRRADRSSTVLPQQRRAAVGHSRRGHQSVQPAHRAESTARGTLTLNILLIME